MYELTSYDVQKYISCVKLNTTMQSESYVEWYWKVGPYLLCGVASTAFIVLCLEFIISQSPERMKGLVIGISIPFLYVPRLFIQLIDFTLCHDILASSGLVILFVSIPFVFIFMVAIQLSEIKTVCCYHDLL